ncbi:hypothetical protein [Chondromyces apiculatus]|nr:hypothetical protein [Chondromyces apiculatus]
MNNDWKALTPHRPLDPGSDVYVTPPSGGARHIADWILAGGSTVLVGGPAGIGKSTEMAQAATLLQAERFACLVPLDRWENMRKLTPEQLLLRIAGRIAYVATQSLRLPVSPELRESLISAGVLKDDSMSVAPGGKAIPSAPALIRHTLSEVNRLVEQRRIALLIDGLEKVPPGAGATDLFDALGTLPENVDLVVVVPWHAAFGPRADAVLRAGEKFVALHAVEVEGEPGEPGRQFLRDLLSARLQLNAEAFEDAEGRARRTLVNEAAQWSGGVPRTFLQLLADAGTYARLRRNAPWPEPSDLADAVADQEDSLRRVLLPGDTQAILAVEGSDGRELALDRKVRLMAHGVLLERLRDRRPVLEVHPLARAAVKEMRRSA